MPLSPEVEAIFGNGNYHNKIDTKANTLAATIVAASGVMQRNIKKVIEANPNVLEAINNSILLNYRKKGEELQASDFKKIEQLRNEAVNSLTSFLLTHMTDKVAFEAMKIKQIGKDSSVLNVINLLNDRFANDINQDTAIRIIRSYKYSEEEAKKIYLEAVRMKARISKDGKSFELSGQTSFNTLLGLVKDKDDVKVDAEEIERVKEILGDVGTARMIKYIMPAVSNAIDHIAENKETRDIVKNCLKHEMNSFAFRVAPTAKTFGWKYGEREAMELEIQKLRDQIKELMNKIEELQAKYETPLSSKEENKENKEEEKTETPGNVI